MEKSKTIKKIILAILIFAIAILAVNNSVFAESPDWIDVRVNDNEVKDVETKTEQAFNENTDIGAEIWGAFDKIRPNGGRDDPNNEADVHLIKNGYAYCVQRDVHCVYEKTKYTVVARIQIEGRHANIRVQGKNEYTNDESENAQLAYLLSSDKIDNNERGYYGYSKSYGGDNGADPTFRQSALWYFLGTKWFNIVGLDEYNKNEWKVWYDEDGEHGGEHVKNFDKGNYELYDQDMEEYARTVDNNPNPYGVYIWLIEPNINNGTNQVWAVVRPYIVENTGSITIHKVDKDNQAALAGAKFIIRTEIDYDHGANGNNKYLSGSEGNWNYTATREEAREFPVNDYGKLEIKGLEIDREYAIFETATPDETRYKLELQDDYRDNIKACKMGDNFNLKNYKDHNYNYEVTLENEMAGSITIHKVDKDNQTALVGAKFVIQTGENTYLSGSEEKWNYEATWEDAKEFEVGEEHKENGRTIGGLDRNRTYAIWETATPGPEYRLEDQLDKNGQKAVAHAVGTNGREGVKIDWDISLEEKENRDTEVIIKNKKDDRKTIKIVKFDQQTGKNLVGAKFKIQTQPDAYEFIKEFEDGKMIRTSNYKEAKEFEITEEGGLILEKLPANTNIKDWTLWETKTPDDSIYPLSEQPGYTPFVGNTNDMMNPREDRNAVEIKLSEVEWKDNVAEIRIPNNQKTVELKLKKTDAITGLELKDAEFVIRASANGQFIGDKDENGYRTLTDRAHAATFKIEDAKEGVTIDGLSPTMFYEVWETKAPEGYDIKKQGIRYDEEIKGSLMIEKVEFGEKNEISHIIPNNPKTGDLEVIKTSESDSTEKLDMGFVVETSNYGKELTTYLSKDENGKYNYESTNPQVFHTGKDGSYKFEGLLANVKYKIWEVDSPDPDKYPISAQDGTKIKIIIDGKERDAVLLTKEKDGIEVNPGEPVSRTFINAKAISISGYVWLDKTEKGSEELDSLYKENSGDEKIKGVTVELVRITDNEVVAKTTTDVSGKYEFKNKILYKYLNNYYVRFNYSELEIDGKKGTNYIPVAYNSKNINEVVKNGSRALMDSIPEKDEDLATSANAGIATTYVWDGISSGVNGLAAFKDKLYNSDTNTLENINLGVREIQDRNYELAQDLKYVRVKLNQHEYTYIFDGVGVDKKYEEGDFSVVPRVAKEAIRTTYVYPSAVENLKEDVSRDGKLEVYMVYDIAITNNGTSIEKNQEKDIMLHITELLDEFDSSKYELSTEISTTGIENNQEITKMQEDISRYIQNWELNGGVAKYKDNDIQVETARLQGENVVGGETHVFIQFKVKDEALLDLLNGDNTNDFKTNAKTKGYYEYSRRESTWETIANSPKETKHISAMKEKNEPAPTARLKLGEERTLSGVVFEDKVVTTNGEALGNGMLDSGENPVKDVKVELLLAKENTEFDSNNLEQALLYNEANPTGTKAESKTDASGKFEFTGVMPGYYFLRLTYGDGSQKIVTPNGEITVLADDYKSTIITSSIIRRALGYGVDPYYLDGFMVQRWHKYIRDVHEENYSTSFDSLVRREEISNMPEENKTMIAGTLVFDISIENTIKDYSEGETHEAKFAGFNLGIIERPKQQVEVSKVITNVSMVNTPNVVFKGNPETDNMPGVTDLDGDSNNNGSTYTRMEIPEENIYGSNLGITYRVDITNKSDKNYYETEEAYKGWYYLFGDKSHSKEALIDVKEVLDCYDQVLTSSELGTSNTTTIDEKTLQYIEKGATGDWGSTNRNKSVEAQAELAGKTSDEYSKVIGITGWKTLSIGDSDSIQVEFTKILSNKDEDMAFTNVAGLSEAENSAQNGDENNEIAKETLKLIKPVELLNPQKAFATVTTPTGNSIQYITTIIAIVGLVILSLTATGITFVTRRKK